MSGANHRLEVQDKLQRILVIARDDNLRRLSNVVLCRLPRPGMRHRLHAGFKFNCTNTKEAHMKRIGVLVAVPIGLATLFVLLLFKEGIGSGACFWH